VTGLSMLLTDLAIKELEILTEAVAQAKRIGVVWNPTRSGHRPDGNSAARDECVDLSEALICDLRK
jgi:hypothetical protein